MDLAQAHMILEQIWILAHKQCSAGWQALRTLHKS